jgi:hypothetical protein
MNCNDCSYLKKANPEDGHVREEVEADFSFLNYINKPEYVCSYSNERIPITFSDGGPSLLRDMNLKVYDGQIGCENYFEKNLETTLKIKNIDPIVS